MSNDKKNDNKQPAGKGIDRRRLLISGGVAAGGLAAFAGGYGQTGVRAVKGLVTGSAGVPTAHAVRGNSLKPEMMIDAATGQLTMPADHVVSPSMCFGCWTICGVRARVDTKNDRILRIAGNPYHPLATTSPAPMQDSVRDVYGRLGGDSGLEGRATSCARGSAMFENLDSNLRVLKPMKRVGKRGEGKWETISFEQLIEEVVEGGNLFGEGHVDGFRAVYDHDTLIDPENPEYGPLANQLLVTEAGNEGRTPLVQRFVGQSFGTVNSANHGSYCGQTYRVGTAASFGNLRGMLHGKPDWKDCRFGLFIGTAPAQAGNPFQRMGRQLAESRTRTDGEGFEYVVVTPVLPASASMASGKDSQWIGVRPSTDLALVMGMIQWIIENQRYDANFLAQPSPAAMANAGEASWSNATHLLIADEDHPRFGSFARADELGLPFEQAEPAEGETADPVYVVKNAAGELVAHLGDQPAELFAEQMVMLDGEMVLLKSSLAMLRDHAAQKSLEEYSEICGIPVETITDLARRLTSYGKQAAVNAHGGTMSGSGFYTAYAIAMLNTLIGNLNAKGGLMISDGNFGPFGKGPRYNFADFEGKRQPKGVAMSRHRSGRYEKSSEFARKKEAGQSPYPAKAPWYPAVGGLSSELVASAVAGYPYKAKIWLNHLGNLHYGINGFQNAIGDKLLDPKVLPLIISVDPFINETSAIADYIIPDTLTYESWGHAAPWADVVQKVSTTRWPVVTPRVAKDAEGRSIDFENFLVSVATKLDMPGFGVGAIKDADGTPHDFLSKEDFYLRGFANVAYAGGNPVPDATDDDLALTGVERHRDLLQSKLSAEEWRKVAFVMSRGGRFGDEDKAWEDKVQKTTYKPALAIWNEELASMNHAMTGERFVGCPSYFPPRLADGSAIRDAFPQKDWPFMASSFKSNLMSSISINVKRLRQVHPQNPVVINRQDAQEQGIGNGDAVIVETPGGRIEGIALLRDGIVRGAIAIEHGYGHWELGARSHEVDGVATPIDEGARAGVNINLLGFADPTRPEAPNVWIDWVSGAVVRQGLPSRLIKVATA